MSTGLIALVFGMSTGRIRQFVSEGMPKNGHNRFNLPACVQWYIENQKDLLTIPDADTKKHRARLLKAKADKLELEVQEKKKRLIDIDEAELIWTNHIVRAKTKMLSMPSKLAPLLADMSEPADIQEEVKRLVYEVLDELAKDNPRNDEKPED